MHPVDYRVNRWLGSSTEDLKRKRYWSTSQLGTQKTQSHSATLDPQKHVVKKTWTSFRQVKRANAAKFPVSLRVFRRHLAWPSAKVRLH